MGLSAALGLGSSGGGSALGLVGSLFGGGGKSSSTPQVPPIPVIPPAAHPPTLGSVNAIAGAANSGIKSKAIGAGFDGTIGTSPQGLTEKESTAPATLLGQ